MLALAILLALFLFAPGRQGDAALAQAVPPPAVSPLISPTITAIDPRQAPNNFDATLVITGGGKVFKTVDGGQSWVSSTLPAMPGGAEAAVYVLAVDPGDPRRVYAGGGDWDVHPPVGALYRSEDMGETWQALTVGLPISPVADIAIDPSDGLSLYIATGDRWMDVHDGAASGMLKSVDGGASWDFVDDGLLVRNITRLALVPGEPQTLYAGSNMKGWPQEGGIFKSVDGQPLGPRAWTGCASPAWRTIRSRPAGPLPAYTGTGCGRRTTPGIAGHAMKGPSGSCLLTVSTWSACTAVLSSPSAWPGAR
jgi:hypothetical protein